MKAKEEKCACGHARSDHAKLFRHDRPQCTVRERGRWCMCNDYRPAKKEGKR